MTKKKYVIVRTDRAGVFAGVLEVKKGNEVTLTKARRLYYWDGASTLSQLAMEGVSKPDNCKFPCEVDKIELIEVIEVLFATKQAQESIANVPGSSVSKNSWTAARIDELDEMELDTVPSDIYQRYLRGELD